MVSILTARKADISLAISTGHIMCYRHGVGLQLHIPTLDANMAAIAAGISANIARLTALGVQVHITELDVSLPLDSSGMPKSEDLTRQAEVYRGIVRACLNNAACTAIQA